MVTFSKIIATGAIPVLLFAFVYLYRIPIFILVIGRLVLRNPGGWHYVLQPRKSYGPDED
jgi:hypothetical protein